MVIQACPIISARLFSAHLPALACIPSRCDSGFEQSRLPSIPRPFSTLPLSPALLMTGISDPAI